MHLTKAEGCIASIYMFQSFQSFPVISVSHVVMWEGVESSTGPHSDRALHPTWPKG